MRRLAIFAAVAAVATGLGYGLWALAAAAAPPSRLELYTARVSHKDLMGLASGGYDVAMARPHGNAYDVQLVLSPAQRDEVANGGLTLTLWHNPAGKTSTHLAAEQQQDGFKVWRPWDGENGIAAELYALAEAHPNLVKLEVIGHTLQNREILALKVTKDARTTADGSRPAVLYSALQHAREWIALEVDRRLLHHFVDAYGSDPEITQLVDSQEFWFVPVANPDGYQLTFTPELRLWRKNARDNNGNGIVDVDVDGVDLNRNFDAHWNYDNEGSSDVLPSQTYRGTAAASEPETQAMQALIQRGHFAFQLNYHSVAELLLYPLGWQDQTPSADTPIFTALTGTPANPAVPGFYPEVSSGLYITNGETCDYAYANAHTLCVTPELSDQGSGGGFVFPDDEALVQKEFQDNLPFAMDVARSATHMTEPSSHLGNSAAPLYTTPFAVSYGDPQTVQVTAQRTLGAVTLKFRINDGTEQSATTNAWAGGQHYGVEGSVHYQALRGTVQGAHVGDHVTVWFEGGGQHTDPFTYTLEHDTGAPVLVVAAEDYTGITPEYAKKDGPSYLDKYLVALDESGLQADVYDIDAHARRAPSALGVLDHYRAVVWYTGDDIIPRAVGMAQGTADKSANDMQLAVRDFLNEGGKLLFSGKYAGTPYIGGYEYNPTRDIPCDPNDQGQDGCTYFADDFMQYYLSANRNLDNVGTAPDGKVPGIVATAGPFAGLTLPLGGSTGAANQDHSMGFLDISRDLPPKDYPQFTSLRAARYDNPSLEPHSGERFVYSDLSSASAPRAYQRLARTVDLTGATAAKLDTWLSYQTSTGRGFVFIEAHSVGQDDWTTLPDTLGHTKEALMNACPSYTIHPQLRHYMTQQGSVNQPDFQCVSTGTTGAWHAATGTSGGWQQWSVDLSAFAGKPVEVVISYMTSSSRLGLFVDDTSVTVDGHAEDTSFESGLGAWRIAGPPDGSPPNPVEMSWATADSVPVSAAITTADTILLGFGFEAIGTGPARQEFMCRAMNYLLGNQPCALPHELARLILPWLNKP